MIISVVWKVLGFGMILFVAAIQAIPTEVNEAARVDGASAWQRTTRVTLPLTMRTVLLVTLVSVIGSLLAFDQFYLMTAGQPLNQTATSVFYVYLNSFPFLKLGYGAALSLILAVHHPDLHGHADDPDATEPVVTNIVVPVRPAWTSTGRPIEPMRNGAPIAAPAAADAVPRQRDLRRDLHDHGAADRRLGAGFGEADRGGGPDATDLRAARVQLRRLPAAVGVPGRAADVRPQQLRHRAADGAVHARA